MTDNAPSIEDLQSQLNDIQASNELLKAQVDELKKQNEEQAANLQKARELNMKFLERLPVAENNPVSSEDTEDSFEKLVDETIETILERRKQK